MISIVPDGHHRPPRRAWAGQVLVATCVVLIAAFGFGTYAQAADSEAAVLDRIAAGCKKRQAEIADSPGQVLDEARETLDRTKQGAARVTRKVNSVTKIDRRSDSFLYSYDQLDNNGGKPKGSCIGINSQYCFELRKPDPSRPWLVSKCVVTDARDLDTGSLGFENPYPRPSRWQATWGEVSIPGIFAQIKPGKLRELAGFAVVAVAETPQQVTLTFSHDIEDFPKLSGKGAAGAATARSILTLDASHDYLPVELSQTAAAHGEAHEYRASRDYTFEADKVARTVTKSLWKVTAGTKIVADTEQVDDIRQALNPVPESEFTLPVFGIPDPVGVEWGSRIPVYAWALIVAAVCAAVVFALRRWKSRS